MEKCLNGVRRALLAVSANEGLFLFAAFFNTAVLGMDIFAFHREQTTAFYTYVMVPWGMALCLHRLWRRAQMRPAGDMGGEIWILSWLFAWVVAPFAIRFGLTFNNVTAWYGYAVVYFAIYAAVSQAEPAVRRDRLKQVSFLFVALSYLLGGALLYCVVTVQNFGAELGGAVFGVSDGVLWGGVNCNITAMVAMCCAILCLAAVSCARHGAGKAFCAAPAVMMMAVVVLTQCRTARYSLLLALSAGCFSLVFEALCGRKRLLRWCVSAFCAAVVLCAGYLLAAWLTQAALAHYAASAAGGAALAPREAIDATFSFRTEIWKNLFDYWRENPKYLLIGNGVGRTGRHIVHGTVYEALGSIAVHNTYLQWIADFGMIGFALQAAFLLMAAGHAITVFLGREGVRTSSIPGGRAMCMVAVGTLATGMMESAPLGAMTPTNLALYFALAQLCGMSREMRREASAGLRVGADQT